MKRLVAALVAAVLIIITVPSCGTPAPSDATGGVTVVTTVFPAFDFARAIAGGLADVTLLLPPGAEPHGFEPSPRDITDVQNSTLFIYNGGESDAWVDKLLADTKLTVLSMMDCVQTVDEHIVEGMEHNGDEHAEPDEHVWTSPKNAALIVAAIRDALCAADEANAGVYRDNADAYLLQLDALDQKFIDATEGASHDTLLFGGRFPFRYLADEYGLQYYAAFPGCAGEAEPSAKTIAFLIDKVNEQQAAAVFYCDASEKLYADTIADGAGSGASAVRLHPCHSVTRAELDSGATYIGLMTINAERIKEALQ